jgi:hypothetical protein
MEQLVQGLQREAKKMFESDEFAQAIGVINYKIETFYDVCRLKGLTGDQGVLMPKANFAQFNAQI